MLHYSLIEYPLTNSADDFKAQVMPSRSYDIEGLITRMLKKGTSATRTDILSVINLYEETIVDIISEGETVNTPLFNTSFSISGLFKGPVDTFDGNRHKINVKVLKGTLLRKAEANVRPEKTQTVTPHPQVLEVKDIVSGKVNEILTPGGVVEVRGNNIRIAGENTGCGLWFVSASGDAVKAQVLAQNKPSVLIAIIPMLAAGTYTIKIVTQYTGGALLKTSKTCIYLKTLVIE